MIADILKTSIRQDMFVARTGGEEFALIVDDATEQATFEIAERIRLLIEQTRFSGDTGLDYGPITISMGICMASDAESADDLYAKADRAIYRSMVNGRNRINMFSATPDRPLKSWLLYRKD